MVLSDHPDLSGLTPESTLNDGNGLWVIQFSSPSEAKAAVEILQSRGITAEPDYYIPPINDEVSYSQAIQSGTHKSWGASDCGFDAFVSKNAELFKSRGVVAVIDTGVDASHPFINGRVMSGYDFVEGGNGTKDGNSHGTHVAGTIIDCVGNAPVSILPLRVFDNQGRGTSVKLVAGINYAAEHEANVINLSLGGGHSAAIDQAISNAISKGCVVVAAAGNDNEDTSNECPAHITTSGTIVVSAGDNRHSKASFSNYHWWGYGSKDGKLYNHPAAGFYQNYESFTTTEPLAREGYSKYQNVPLYKRHIDGAHGENWYLEKQEVVYLTVWKYQTRTLTTVYCYYRWGKWSSWQDAAAISDSENNDIIHVEVMTLYR